MSFFRILIGVVFLLWSAACTVGACGHWNTFKAVSAGKVYDLNGTGTMYPPNNETALYLGISLLMALGTFGVGGYLITKR